MVSEGLFSEKLSEFTTTEEISNAMDDVSFAINTLLEAVNNRLEELGFDEEEYKDGSNEEIDHLLELRDQLDNASCYIS